MYRSSDYCIGKYKEKALGVCWGQNKRNPSHDRRVSFIIYILDTRLNGLIIS